MYNKISRPYPTAHKRIDHDEFQEAELAQNSVSLRILIPGPNIRGHNMQVSRASRCPGSQLRIDLYSELNRSYNVSLGDYSSFNYYKDTYSRRQCNLSEIEISSVQTDNDAIIMLPSSPGSYTELGRFSNYPDICNKMLIIVDKEHRSKESYINYCALPMAEHCGAVISYLCYTDIQKCTDKVYDFLHTLSSNRFTDNARTMSHKTLRERDNEKS